jgi:hypothetical protein
MNGQCPSGSPLHAALRLALASILLLSGCSPAARSPDAIRHDSANATAAAVRDFKAIVQGIFEGLRQKAPININKASTEELQRLPGIDAQAARRIISGRPYESSTELLHRRILSKGEYDSIASQVVAR